MNNCVNQKRIKFAQNTLLCTELNFLTFLTSHLLSFGMPLFRTLLVGAST